MPSGYLRYPHVHADLLTFVAGDDVWLAPADGGRAWRLSADDVPVSYPRFSPDGTRVAWASYPQEARRGPLVTVADEFAGSDGDVVTAAIKLLGLGPVVGTRTWGGVIGIEGYQDLIDGTSITVPRYAISFDAYGWGVENYGVDPDVEVLNTPDDAAAGRDPQLETAFRLALEALDKQPLPMPPDPDAGPSKARHPLPNRSPRQ